MSSIRTPLIQQMKRVLLNIINQNDDANQFLKRRNTCLLLFVKP